MILPQPLGDSLYIFYWKGDKMKDNLAPCIIAGFRRGVNDICALLGCCAV